jgi:hypothetical protein
MCFGILDRQTDGRTDGRRNTLATRGLEELFSSCAVVSGFWFWWEIGFGVTYPTYLEYNTVVVLC